MQTSERPYLIASGFIAFARDESKFILLKDAAVKHLNDLYAALGALGAIGNGYCFCSRDRDPNRSDHEPECRDARAALRQSEGDVS